MCLCWFCSLKPWGVVHFTLWLRIQSVACCEWWRLLMRSSVTSPFIFVCWKSAVAMKIWPSGEGTDTSWSNPWGADLGCGLCFWKSLGHGILAMIHPKRPWYYVKQNPSSIPSWATKIPLHCTQIPLQKWGIWDVTVGVFTLLVPIHEAGTCEKNPSRWNNQFSYKDGMTSNGQTKLGSVEEFLGRNTFPKGYLVR